MEMCDDLLLMDNGDSDIIYCFQLSLIVHVIKE